MTIFNTTCHETCNSMGGNPNPIIRVENITHATKISQQLLQIENIVENSITLTS